MNTTIDPWALGYWTIHIDGNAVTRFEDQDRAETYFDRQFGCWDVTVSMTRPDGSVWAEWDA